MGPDKSPSRSRLPPPSGAMGFSSAGASALQLNPSRRGGLATWWRGTARRNAQRVVSAGIEACSRSSARRKLCPIIDSVGSFTLAANLNGRNLATRSAIPRYVGRVSAIKIAETRIVMGDQLAQQGEFDEIHGWREKLAEQMVAALQGVAINVAAEMGKCIYEGEP